MTGGSKNSNSSGSGSGSGNVVELRPGQRAARAIIDEWFAQYVSCLSITAHAEGSEAAHNEALGMLQAAICRIRCTAGYDTIQRLLEIAIVENDRHRQASRKLIEEHRL